jgi:UDP-N-acetylglucosamine--N-acetylmuramyl-(pentapeptide) pyrophosphoryl-undecaprenol N-acetylglucosamine transferase
MTRAQAPSVAFTGGGSGGHIYPGLAVAEALRERMDARLAWIGNESGMDRGIVEKAGVEFFGIPSGKFRRDLSLKNVSDLFKIVSGFFRARAILKKMKPALLFSKGGFVSVPPCFAAKSLGIPVFAHESDATPGLATRLSSLKAERVFVAYDSTIAKFPANIRPRVERIGNPVRKAVFQGDRERGLSFLGFDGAKPVVLFLGGSQGAKQVNDLVSACRESLSRRCSLAHQTGEANSDPSVKNDSGYRAFAFLHEELPDVYAAADIIVGRSGAGTIWEAATLGKPMVLIPLSGAATRGDQVINAELFKASGAAIVLSGTEASAEALESAVLSLLDDPEAMERMRKACRSMAGRDAAQAIAERISERITRIRP